MAYVSVPKDLSKIKSKVLFSLTQRQLICFSAGAVAGHVREERAAAGKGALEHHQRTLSAAQAAALSHKQFLCRDRAAAKSG